ncbi:Cpr62Ba [Drosophila busckii]|uniref:Cpr62Ba n=1 Tax=Drosophila busckii TaxID=30019 RepID=A0A0M4E8I2_DROBS|nr:Cpr62Ba [Drosophila busckii]
MKLSLSLSLLLWCLHIAHTQCGPAHYIEFYNDYAHNHDEQRLGYRHHYHISDVQTGVSILHGEQRQGDQVTGSYSQLAPSGEVRSVYYEVRGGQGYRAVIIQRTANSRVHQALEFERKQALQALPLAKPVAFVI